MRFSNFCSSMYWWWFYFQKCKNEKPEVKNHLEASVNNYDRESPIYYVCKIFQKTNISYPLIRTRTCVYQGLRNVSFSENFAYVLNGRFPAYIIFLACTFKTLVFKHPSKRNKRVFGQVFFREIAVIFRNMSFNSQKRKVNVSGHFRSFYFSWFFLRKWIFYGIHDSSKKAVGPMMIGTL